jgi:hypothetical protein
VALVIQFDDPLALGLGACLPNSPDPLADQGMVRMDDGDIRKGFARLGGILLRIIRLS